MPVESENLVFVRCGACRNLFVVDEWTAGVHCPECGSNDTSPAPVIEDALEYSLASRETGPTIEDIRLARVIHWLGLAPLHTLRNATAEQTRAATLGEEPAPPLGEILVRDGVLSRQRLDAIVRAVRVESVPESWRRFGEFAVSARIITAKQLAECMKIQEDLVARRAEFAFLGHILIEMGYCKEAQVFALLKAQRIRRNEGLLKELEDALASRGRERRWAFRLPGTRREQVTTLAGVLGIAAGLWLYFHPAFLARPEMYVWLRCPACKAVYGVNLDREPANRVCRQCGRPGVLPVVKCEGCGATFELNRQGACPNCHSTKFTRAVSPGDLP